MSGVSPVAMAAFGLAPALSRRSTRGALPFVHARESGVMPKSLAMLASARARSSSSALATSFQCAAQSSAVDPSADRMLTSAFRSTSARTFDESWLLAASTSPRSSAAPAVPATISSVSTAPATPLCSVPGSHAVPSPQSLASRRSAYCAVIASGRGPNSGRDDLPISHYDSRSFQSSALTIR